MSLVKKIISGISMLCVFGCSSPDEKQERKDLIRWLDIHLSTISNQAANDIEQEKKGFYPHDAKTEYNSKGYIDYVLKEKNGKRLVVSENSLLTSQDIENTDGYSQLLNTVTGLGYQLTLKRVTIDGDEVDSYEELDEYIDEKEDYFVIHISGW